MMPVAFRTTPSCRLVRRQLDRKSTRLNSSHSQISYAVFCLQKKNPASALHAPRDHLHLALDRKSTRLHSNHLLTSNATFRPENKHHDIYQCLALRHVEDDNV